MAMPERIWANPQRSGNDPDIAATQYIRADLAVLATTHQRTVEALREAEKAIRNAYGAITSGQTEDKDAAGTLRAALARIKEAT